MKPDAARGPRIALAASAPRGLYPGDGDLRAQRSSLHLAQTHLSQIFLNPVFKAVRGIIRGREQKWLFEKTRERQNRVWVVGGHPALPNTVTSGSFTLSSEKAFPPPAAKSN